MLAGVGAILILGPLFGLATTMFALWRTSAAVGADGVAPAQRQEALAARVGVAEWSTVAGLLVFPVGVALFSVSLYMILKKPSLRQTLTS